MYCKHCGAQNADDAVFCESCGQRIAETPSNQAPQYQQAQQPAGKGKLLFSGRTSNISINIVCILIGIFFVIAGFIICIIPFTWLESDKHNYTSSSAYAMIIPGVLAACIGGSMIQLYAKGLSNKKKMYINVYENHVEGCGLWGKHVRSFSYPINEVASVRIQGVVFIITFRSEEFWLAGLEDNCARQTASYILERIRGGVTY